MERERITCDSVCDYELISNSDQEKVTLLLHGYAESSGKVLYKLKDYVGSTNILAPNGPFPLPVRVGERFKLTYAWYFYDTIEEKYYIDHDYPTQFLKGLVLKLFPNLKELTIIGFSQGGYLAPFIGEAMEQTKKVISVNAQTRWDRLPNKKVSFPLYCVNGTEDDIVDPKKAERMHQEFLDQGNSGKFIHVDGATHRICEKIQDKVKELVDA